MTTKDPHKIGCLCPCHRGLRVWRCDSPCKHEPAPGWVALQQENRDMAAHMLRGAGLLLKARDELVGTGRMRH